MIQTAIRTQSTFELEHRVRQADGRVGWRFSRAIPVFDQQGAVQEWLGAASDITARKQAEENLQEADRRKDEFLAMLAHELRNPLAPIRNTLQILSLTADGNQTVTSATQLMGRQVDQLVRLVDDLLDVSRISRGTIRLRPERIDLNDVIRQAIETSRPILEAHQHTFTVNLPTAPLYIQGDTTRLIQVVSNLLNNAAKFTPEGGRVGLTLERVEEESDPLRRTAGRSHGPVAGP